MRLGSLWRLFVPQSGYEPNGEIEYARQASDANTRAQRRLVHTLDRISRNDEIVDDIIKQISKPNGRHP